MKKILKTLTNNNFYFLLYNEKIDEIQTNIYFNFNYIITHYEIKCTNFETSLWKYYIRYNFISKEIKNFT